MLPVEIGFRFKTVRIQEIASQIERRRVSLHRLLKSIEMLAETFDGGKHPLPPPRRLVLTQFVG